MFEYATPLQALFNLALWLIIVLLLSAAYRYPFRLSKRRRIIGYILIVIFCLYPFWSGDYFHYKEDFYNYISGGLVPQEPVYLWIMTNLSMNSYTVFRFVVWGGALLFLFYSYRKCLPVRDTALLFFAVCYLPAFSYARVSIAMALILFGLSIVVSGYEKNKTIRLLIGFICVICAELFHRSAIIGIVAAIASFFLINAKKKTMVSVGLLVPVVLFLIGYVIQYIISFSFGSDSFISENQVNLYLVEAESNSVFGGGWGERVGIVLTRGSLYASALLYLMIVWSGKFLSFTAIERIFSSYAFIVILIGFLFLFDFGFNTYVLHYRTLNFAAPANAVFLASAIQHKYYLRYSKFVFVTSLFASFYSLLYAFYGSF